MAIDVESVATDKDLEAYTLGKDALEALFRADMSTAKVQRQTVLTNVLNALKKRRPPIFEVDLVDLHELKQVVCYGTLALLYGGAIDHAESPNVARAKNYQRLYADELAALQPSVMSGSTGSSLSVRISRG